MFGAIPPGSSHALSLRRISKMRAIPGILTRLAVDTRTGTWRESHLVHNGINAFPSQEK
jgi:hypothetical protein